MLKRLDELTELLAADLKAGKKVKSLQELPSEYRQGMTDVALQKANRLAKRKLRLEKLTELTSGKAFKVLFPDASVQIIGIRAGRAFVELFADDTKLVRGLRSAERKLRAFGDGIRTLGLKVVAMGAGLMAPLVGSAKAFSTMGDSVAKMAKCTGLSVATVKGEITWRSKLDQVELFDAKFAWGDYGMTEVTDYTCNLLTIYSKSGEFMWQMADSGYSVIKKILLYAGNLTASQSVNSGYQKRIGTGSEISELWPDAVANFNSSSNNVLIAPGSKLEAYGGTLIASCGSLLGW